jgi:uncharacterized protein
MHLERIIRKILEGYVLPVDGIHGLCHWGRVLENGLRLAGETGANVKVVTLFALFHDARRYNESWDPGHGCRGAELAMSLRTEWFHLSDPEAMLLYEACALHTESLTTGDITIQTCWDADRLDLGRVGMIPRARRLCTEVAQRPETIQWAHQRSVQGLIPQVIEKLWDEYIEKLITFKH